MFSILFHVFAINLFHLSNLLINKSKLVFENKVKLTSSIIWHWGPLG